MLKDIDFIPNDTVLYDLAGKRNQQMGLQDLTWEKVYDYEVRRLVLSDGFHYSLYNVFGTRVLQGTSTLNPFTIFVGDLSLGLYFLVVNGKNGNIAGTARILRK